MAFTTSQQQRMSARSTHIEDANTSSLLVRTQLAATPDPVTNLQLEEITYEEGDKLLHRIAINRQQSIRANYYEVNIDLMPITQ